MTQPAAAGPALALRYDAWFDSPWGRYAWRIETRAVLGALGPLTGRRVADICCGTGRLLRILTSNDAKAVALTPTLPCSPSRLPEALLPEALLPAPTHHQFPLADASMDAAITVATLEFTAGPAQVLAELARITPPGGRLVAAVLNSASLWGILDQPARRAPYSGGCFIPRSDLLALGRRHGQARIRSALFTASRLCASPLLGTALEITGKITPRLGAFQVLTVITGT